jgi:hypothetical protein
MKKHQTIAKLISLYFYDELKDDERQKVLAHIESCEMCRQQFKEMQALHETLDKKLVQQPSDEMLAHARAQLRNRLQQEKLVTLRNSWWQRLADFASSARPVWQGVAVAATLAIGLFAGRFIWAPMMDQQKPLPDIAAIEAPETAPFISNISLIEYDPHSGNVTIKYKSINDVVVRGKVNDEPVRNLLAYAIRTEGNPGRRLTAVRAVGRQSLPDKETEDALIYALENDAVDGVRLRAAQVLRALPINDGIKKTFIRVLMKDPNPSIRIEAVEALSQVKEAKDVFPVLQDAAKDDENEFIRLKTSNAIERLENPQIGK